MEEEKEEKFENKYLEACGNDKYKGKAKEVNRFLKFLLTDGISDIIAIEHEKLKDISINSTLPGSKIKLIGPIEVRRGIYFLRNNNIELVFGNSDENLKILNTNKSFNDASTAILNPAGLHRKGLVSKKLKEEEKKDNSKNDSSEMSIENLEELNK